MRLIAAFFAIILCFSSLAEAENSYLEVTASGNRQISLAIASPRQLAGAAPADVAKQIAEVLQFDLTLAGPFTVTAAPVTEKGVGIRPGEFDFAPWEAIGTNLLIKSGFSVAGDTVTVEFRLYDVLKRDGILAKRYTGNLKDIRKITHTFSDDVMEAVTGEAGPFTGKVAFVSTASGNKELYLMDYDGYNVQRLTQNGSINLNPDFSPNGREIVYTSYKKGNPDLYRRELFTGAEARVTSNAGTSSGGAWAPDGTRIALSQSKGGDPEIYIIDKVGKQLAKLTSNSAIDISPSWSPDGSQIAFVSDRLGSPQIFIMSSDGTNVRRLTTNGSYNVSPRWSPKGDRIVYIRQQQGGFQVYSISPDGTGELQLTKEGDNHHPRWSPDGRYITFSSRRGGTESIFVMRADGSGQTRVSRSKGKDSHPAWSPRW